MTRKRVAVLGSTGSVGRNALQIAALHPDRFQIVALSAHSSTEALAAQLAAWPDARGALAGAQGRPTGWSGADPFLGERGILELLDHCAPDLVLNAITGAAGLRASEWTLRAGATLALANKESLVMAGSHLMPLAQRHGATILPVDSEHCAIHQCLAGNERGAVRRIYLTASGGPFRSRLPDTFAGITPAEALRHPTWDMGRRITIGSATMMNKAFEVVEAHWLFGLRAEQIEVLVHPQSIVHSMVEYVDGSMLAQLGLPDMRVPILYCMAWPDRLPFDFAPFAAPRWASLNFEPADPMRYPAVPLAYEVLQRGGDSGALLNAADEVLTEMFLDGAIPFPAITGLVTEVVRSRPARPIDGIDAVLDADREGRALARRLAAGLPRSGSRA